MLEEVVDRPNLGQKMDKILFMDINILFLAVILPQLGKAYPDRVALNNIPTFNFTLLVR
jgi:hypothetical protein